MDAAILTPIPIEYSIARGFLSNLVVNRLSNFTCEVGQFEGKHHIYQIAIREIGSRETAAALATQAILEELKPSLLILLGICGGVKDVKIGDVVVGTKAYGYEAGKETSSGFVARPETYHYDKELIEHIKILQYNFDWKKRSVTGDNAKVIYGPIASGNKVIATKESPIFKQLKLHYNDTTAIEMEATGFAEAAFKYKNVRILNIRGVSDLLDKKQESDIGGSQEQAILNAAAFTFEMLWNFDPRGWITTSNGYAAIKDDSKETFSVKHKDTIEKLITKGSTNEAIRKLQEYSSDYNQNIREQILHLIDRWSVYTRNNRMGLLDSHHLSVERSQIVVALIELINS